MATTLMGWRATVRVGFAHFNAVFLNRPVLSHMMQMTIMQVIDVPIMFNARVLAVGAVLVIMVFVGMTHRFVRIRRGFELRNLN
jgi:hypothetical protein